MNEYDMIETLTCGFSKSQQQQNAPFECDAEIIEMSGKLYGISMDEFSEEEDLFFTADFEHLGWNLAVATLTDLFAAGVIPRFYMHSVVAPKNNIQLFLKGISQGIRDALNKAECFLIGGDTGTSETWRYTGVAIGEVEKPITRLLPETKQTLWITGRVGDANVAAFSHGSVPKFELRMQETEYIRNHATAAMDTSGGVIDALWTLHRLNSDMRFDIQSERIPFAEEAIALEKETFIRKEATLLGGAGEYELLFTTETSAPPCPNATAIGTVYTHEKSGVFLGKKAIQAPPDPRSFSSLEQYIQKIITITEELYA